MNDISIKEKVIQEMNWWFGGTKDLQLVYKWSDNIGMAITPADNPKRGGWCYNDSLSWILNNPFFLC